MKLWKLLTLFVISIAAVIALAMMRSALYPSPDISEALAARFEEGCLLPDQAPHPVWECYEIPASGAPHQTVSIRHESGEQQQVLTFQENDQTKFRFTPTQKGVWTFSTGGDIDIDADRPAYAKGFVAAEGSKWIRSATGKAFVPQYVMYDKPDIDAGLDEFIDGHGFTGFHITNLRDFIENPGYFEAVALKTYRHGGVTHFWIWGDKSRNETPSTYGVDADLLYTEIVARLAPIPGWTVSYGFDLFEWAKAEEIEQFRAKLQADSSYHHMIGGRGHKNEYKEISSKLDYASWEWHRPSYEDYRDHLKEANQRPAFSEDRFRFRVPTRYPEKDYDIELTRQGLWDSAMAGGVANIWGYKPEGKEFSEPYPNKEEIKTYSRFIDSAFSVGMTPDNDLISDGYCLRDSDQAAICYSEQPETLQFNLREIAAPMQIVAVDTRSPYEEIEVVAPEATFDWQPPYESDWAFRISAQAEGDRT
ncbi:MAG: hypothetical protein ACR2FS_11105 [Phormidesmis sp.]